MQIQFTTVVLRWMIAFACMVLIFFYVLGQVQNSMIPFERIAELQGVPCPVRKIVQDSMGFIWLGTNEGLARYDGKKFKKYQSVRNDDKTLSNNIVNDMVVDQLNRVWVATNGGLCYYDYTHDRFFRIHLPDTLESLDLFRIHSLTVDDQNRIWFCTKTKAHLLSPGGHILRSFFITTDPSITFKSIYVDANDRLFIGTNQSTIWVWDICTNEKYTLQVHSPVSESLSSSTTTRFIIKWTNDALLVGSWMGGLNKLVGLASGKTEIMHCENSFTNDIRSNIVTGIGLFNEECWWVGTHGAGIFLYHPGKNKFYYQIKHDPENPYSLMDDYINDILVDNAGIIWVASNNGLSKYDRSSHKFTTVSIPFFGEEKSVYRMPYQIVEDVKDTMGSGYFVTVPGLGLLKFFREGNRFELIRHLGHREKCELNQRIYEIHRSEETLYILQNQSLLIYQEKNDLCKAILLQDSCKFYTARKMILDKNGNIWIATSSEGLLKLSRDGAFCERFQYTANAANRGIQDNTILCMLLDDRGDIWLGSQNSGLSKFDTKEKRFSYFRHSKSESNTLPDNSVFDLHQDADNMLWIATENGLTRLDTRTYKMKTFTSQEGLPSSTVNSITPDFEGNLWLATSKGLCYFNQRDGSFQVYSMSDGLAGNRMEGAVCLSKDGTMLFSTNSKISIRNPGNTGRVQRAHDIYITSLLVYGLEKPLRRRNGALLPVEIDYQHNIFSVEFIALNYANSSRMNYAYKLDGVNEDWIYTGNRSEAHFTNLKGGEYTLRIKASNYDGQWIESKDLLRIHILPPFWKTKSFTAAWISLLLAILFLFIRLRILENRHIQQLRMRIARDLHDEVGSSLSGIHLTSNMMMQTNLERDDQHKFLERIQSASKSAIEMMGEIIWSLQPNNDQLDKMMERMRMYASAFLEAADIPFEFYVEGQITGKVLPLDVRRDFLLIYKELLNNIAKHSKAHFVSIRVTGTKDKIVLRISDNGVGFNPEIIRKGNGLKNIRERVEAINVSLKIESAPGKGTHVELEWKR